MKSIRSLIPILAILLMASMQVACAGQAARNTAGTAVINQLWEGDGDRDVNADVSVGISLTEHDDAARQQAFQDLADFTAVLATRDRARITFEAKPKWPALRDYASAGIHARQNVGTISPSNAAEREERLVRFTSLLDRLAERL